jgi:hypothetical protein
MNQKPLQRTQRIRPPHARVAQERLIIGTMADRMVRAYMAPASMNNCHERPFTLRCEHDFNLGRFVGRKIGIAPDKAKTMRRLPSRNAAHFNNCLCIATPKGFKHPSAWLALKAYEPLITWSIAEAGAALPPQIDVLGESFERTGLACTYPNSDFGLITLKCHSGLPSM